MEKAIIVIAVCQVWQVVMKLIEWWKRREQDRELHEFGEYLMNNMEEENKEE